MAKVCSNCGKAVRERAKFCEECGATFREGAAQESPIGSAQETTQNPKQFYGPGAPGKKKKRKVGVVAAVLVIVIGLPTVLIVYKMQAEEKRLAQAAEQQQIAEQQAAEQQRIAEEERAQKRLQAENIFSMYVPIQPGQNARADGFIVTEKNLTEANLTLISLVENKLQEILSLSNRSIYQEVEHFDSSEYTNLDPATSIIYPGAIFTGDSIFADYTILPLARKPIELAANFATSQADSISALVDDPKFSTVTVARNQLVEKNLTSDVAANITFSSKTYNEEHEVRAFLGLSVPLPPVISSFLDFSAPAGFSLKEKKTNMLVKFTQVYYTLSVHPPESPVDFFKDGFNTATLGDISPAYVSEVSYGRTGVLSINSKYSESEINAALKASIEVAKVIEIGEAASLEASFKNVLENSEMNLYIIGGSSIHAGGAVSGYNGFMEFITSGNNVMEEKQYAVPISYKLRYVSDNSLVPGGMVKKSTISESNPESMKITITLNSIDTSFKNATVRVNTTNMNAVTKQDLFEYTRVDEMLDKNALANPIELLLTERDDTAFLDFSDIAVNDGYKKAFDGGDKAINERKLMAIGDDGARILFADIPVGTTQRQIQFSSDKSKGAVVLTLNLTIKKEAVEKKK